VVSEADEEAVFSGAVAALFSSERLTPPMKLDGGKMRK
jgi:hypothetical protein